MGKQGQKYELDCHNLTTSTNFVKMYDQYIDQIVRADVTKKRTEPAWMDLEVKVCNKSQTYGCNVTHDLIHLELCLVGDEVIGNISMKAYGHIGGQLHLATKGRVVYQKFYKIDRNLTLIGLTSLDGEPVTCIVIIQGSKVNRSAEDGINVSIQQKVILETVTSF